jgi:hypothetical protein
MTLVAALAKLGFDVLPADGAGSLWDSDSGISLVPFKRFLESRRY